MHICMLTSLCFPTIGGVEAHIYNLCKSLQNLGHKVTIVHTLIESHSEGEQAIIENYNGLEIHRLYLLGNNKKARSFEKFTSDNNLSFLLGFYKKARPNFFAKQIYSYIGQLVINNNIDILHQHDFSANIISTKILSKKLPVIITNHTGEFLMINRREWLRPSLKILLNHYNHLIAPSKELCNIPFMEKKGRVTYIPNGVSLDVFNTVDDTEKMKLREKMSLSKEAILVLCARRWAPTKGVKFFVESVPLILKKINSNQKVLFLISGNNYEGYPAYKEGILSFIKDNNLSNYISLLGDIPHHEIGKYYKVSDIVVLPSLMEATSLTGLEAMACGKPLIGTNVGGIPEIIEHLTTGIIVEPKKPDKIAEAILSLINDRILMEKIGKKARQQVEKEFSWEVIAEKTVEVYKNVLGL